MKLPLVAVGVALLISGTAAAQQAGDVTEPEVVITPRDSGQVKEYRVNGRLYMIEITPAKGPRYFLIDTDGDGSLETRQNATATGIQIPAWTLLRW